MDISIIIVSYNVKDLLRICLKSVIDVANNFKHEIFVVDNCSSDGSISAKVLISGENSLAN